MQNNEGYTLLEMIVVLLIVSIVIFTIGFSLIKIKDKNDLNILVREISSDYSEIQSHAILNKEEASIVIKKDKYILYHGNKIFKEKSYNKKIKVNTNFSDNEVKINDKGRISKAGRISIELNKFKKEIIFSIGGGRYRIQ